MKERLKQTHNLPGWKRVLFLLVPTVFLLQGCVQPAKITQPVVSQVADPAELIRTGDKAYEQGRFDQAQSLYGALTNVAPRSFSAWFKLGNAHLRVGEADRAEQAYLEALELNPSDARAWYNLATARLMSAKGALRGAAENLEQQDPAHRLAIQRLRVLDDLIFKSLEEPAAQSEPRAKSSAPASAVRAPGARS